MYGALGVTKETTIFSADAKPGPKGSHRSNPIRNNLFMSTSTDLQEF
jgi:hypothetical protein